MKKTKKLSIAALMAAMCVAVLSIGSLIESLDLTLSVFAGVLVMICATEFGDRTAFSVFFVAGVISLLLPLKTAGLFFIGFFGWYPILQKKILMLRPLISRVLRFFIFNLSFVLIFFATAFLVTGVKEVRGIHLVLLLIANLCFVIYDILLDRLLLFYILKIRKRLRM